MKISSSAVLTLALGAHSLPALCATVDKAKPAAQTTKITASTARSMVSRILKETSALRQLPIKRAVPSGVKTRSAIEKMIEGQLETELSVSQVAAVDLYLKQLGLAPANFDLKTYYTRMMGEQIAGYYDTKANTFYTSEVISPGLLETVMAHELTHALQDQNFDLKRLQKWPRHDSDARLAMTSLVEGDATLTMSRYVAAKPFRSLAVLGATLQTQLQTGSKVLRSGPQILQDSMSFPYVKGMAFVTDLYQIGGWEEVSAAFDDLPQSTEQILHTEKYLIGESPEKVALRDVSAQLGKGWTLLDHDVNGEMGLGMVLGEHLDNPEAADRAAAGWAGDRYAVYRGPKKSGLVVQDCLWDNAAEAREWREAYARGTTKRFGKIKAQKRGTLTVWNAAPQGVWMEQRGRRVLILEGAVGAFNPVPVFAALWR